jgi:serine/threonine protein kinase
MFGVRNLTIMLMEYIPGMDLKKYLLTHGLLSEEKLKSVVKQLVEALIYCHH